MWSKFTIRLLNSPLITDQKMHLHLVRRLAEGIVKGTFFLLFCFFNWSELHMLNIPANLRCAVTSLNRQLSTGKIELSSREPTLHLADSDANPKYK